LLYNCFTGVDSMKYIEDEIMKVTKKKKKFNYLIGNKSTHLIIYNPSQILKTKKHKNTIYWYFDALIKSINGNPVIGARLLGRIWGRLRGRFKEKSHNP